jgi:translation initiation factor 2B subunit (eIF-2B alpha/beta/delta family)
MTKKKEFDRLLINIKNVKIQGARNIAKAALRAYRLISTVASKKKLLASRPTEPMMENVLELAEKTHDYKKILDHFDFAQEKINKAVLKLIRKNDVIFTHCHSTNVVNALIYSHKKGKKFEVYNTETRPLFQGRKTARELRKAGIKVTMFVDSALSVALSKETGKKPDKIFLGADALLKTGIINKIGSETIVRIAEDEKIPVYIVADSWKFTKKKIPIEQRKLNEIWDTAPKNIKLKNPAFEFVDKKYLSGIVTELGIQRYGDFVRKMS